VRKFSAAANQFVLRAHLNSTSTVSALVRHSWQSDARINLCTPSQRFLETLTLGFFHYRFSSPCRVTVKVARSVHHEHSSNRFIDRIPIMAHASPAQFTITQLKFNNILNGLVLCGIKTSFKRNILFTAVVPTSRRIHHELRSEFSTDVGSFWSPRLLLLPDFQKLVLLCANFVDLPLLFATRSTKEFGNRQYGPRWCHHNSTTLFTTQLYNSEDWCRIKIFIMASLNLL
jgi:hypothetical protein